VTSTTIRAIQTEYKGYKFRSRLEARVAVVLDALGIKWLYEDEGFDLGEEGYYLPDFWLPEFNTFLEVKAGKPSSKERQKLQKLMSGKSAFGAFAMDFGRDKPFEYLLPKQPDSWEAFYPWPENLPRLKTAKVRPICDLPVDRAGDMTCPFCGCDYVHSGGSETHEVHPHIPVRGPIEVTKFWSEQCSHTWEVAFAFHKGNTSMVYCCPDDGNVTPLEAAIAKNPEALKKGKAARFEHGECG